MKRFTFLLSMLSIFLLASCSQTVESPSASEEETAEAKVVYAANDAVDVEIEGMMCSMGCKGAIEKELNNTAGIAECSVDFENGTAHIAFDNSYISKEEITETIGSVNHGAYKAVISDNPVQEEEETETENTEA